MNRLVEEQLAQFKRNFDKVDLSFAKRKNLTAYDVLIIASLIEREAMVAKERPLIASVIYNRLREGIPLGIDATVRFVTGNWKRPLRQSELANPSPYNTRVHANLPPGPIGNPGLDSIRAAARPAKTDYLFYVVKVDSCGEHKFAETDAEFQAYVNEYNRAREARGRQVADQVLTTLAGVVGFPVGTQPLARDDDRGLRRAGPRLALPEASGPAGALRRRRSARSPPPATAEST